MGWVSLSLSSLWLLPVLLAQLLFYACIFLEHLPVQGPSPRLVLGCLPH